METVKRYTGFLNIEQSLDIQSSTSQMITTALSAFVLLSIFVRLIGEFKYDDPSPEPEVRSSESKAESKASSKEFEHPQSSEGLTSAKWFRWGGPLYLLLFITFVGWELAALPQHWIEKYTSFRRTKETWIGGMCPVDTPQMEDLYPHSRLTPLILYGCLLTVVGSMIRNYSRRARIQLNSGQAPGASGFRASVRRHSFVIGLLVIAIGQMILVFARGTFLLECIKWKFPVAYYLFVGVTGVFWTAVVSSSYRRHVGGL